MPSDRSTHQTDPSLRSLREERRRYLRQGRPQRYCARCRSVVFAKEPRCLQCGDERPRIGWPDLLSANDPWLGKIIDGRYLINRPLGQGASGLVYQAESLSISRQFAIKIITTDQKQAQAEQIIARFNREIEALSRLRNPHIVSFYEILNLGDTFVAALMDLINGSTLEELIYDQGPLQIPRALAMLRQVANGLFEAHQAGMIHRDLKPENLMVEPLPAGDDFLHILDFGIVRLTDDDTVSMTHGFIGTPLYASPEQAMAKTLDHRSDIYSLGAILFFMLTGQPPFVSEHVYEVLRMHAHQAPPRLAHALPGRLFPETLEQLLAKMLAKSPDDRPADLSAVIKELDRLAIEHSSDARSEAASTIQDTGRRPSFSRDEHTSADTLLMAIGQREKAQTPTFFRTDTPTPATDRRLQAIPAQIRQRSEKTSADKTIALFKNTPTDSAAPFHLRQPAHLARATHSPDDILAILEDGDAPVALLFEPHRTHPRPVPIPTQTGLTSFALGSTSILAGHRDGLVSQIKLEDSTSKTIFKEPNKSAITALAANQQKRCILAATASGTIYLHLPSRSHADTWSPIRKGPPAIAMSLNRTATTVAIAHQDHSVALFNLADPKVPLAKFRLDAPVRSMAISPDDYLLLVALADNSTSLIQLPTTKTLLTTKGGRAQIMAVHFTKNATPIAVCAIDQQIQSLNFEDIRSAAASF